MVQVINRHVRNRIYLCLRVAVGIDVGPVITVTCTAVTRRSRDARVTGPAINAVVHGRIVVIGTGICDPGTSVVTGFTTFNNRQAGMTLRTVACSEGR